MKSSKSLFLMGWGLIAAGFLYALLLLLQVWIDTRPLVTQTVVSGRVAHTDWIQTGSKVRLGLDLQVRSQVVAPELRPQRAGRLIALYRFPVDYRVHDRAGKVLLAQRVLVESGRRAVVAKDRAYLGEVRVERVRVQFDPVQLDESVPVRVEAIVHPDRRFGAELNTGVLHLMPAATATVAAGKAFLLVLTGLFVMLVGLGLELRYGQHYRTDSRLPRRRMAAKA